MLERRYQSTNLLLLTAVVVISLLSASVSANNAPHWAQGLFPAQQLNGAVYAICQYDDGSGPAVYVGGDFTEAAGITVDGIAKWSNNSWHAVGGGLSSVSEGVTACRALCVCDDGTGAALYAGGSFSTAGSVSVNNIARWKSGVWTALGTGTDEVVNSLCVYDDGTGPALYVGGGFTNAGNASNANCIARWTHGIWQALGTGTDGFVQSLCVYDDNAGPALYVGGYFTTAGGVTTNRIARWRNNQWQPLGQGSSGPIQSLCVYDDGSGPALCAGGAFSRVDGVAASNVAKWKCGTWQALGAGTDSLVESLCVYDDGTGPALCAGGLFTTAGGAAANHVAMWKNNAWNALGSGTDDAVESVCAINDGNRSILYAGGLFLQADNVGTTGIATFSNGRWQALGSGLNDAVLALHVYNDGSGLALYAGGLFTNAGNGNANCIAKWRNGIWQPLGTGIDRYAYVDTICGFDIGSGPAVYAGGGFQTAGDIGASNIARWRNGAWEAVGTGVDSEVRAIAVGPLAKSSRLYVGSTSTGTGYDYLHYISSTGLWNAYNVNGSVYSLAQFDDGNPFTFGPLCLFAGGEFATSGSPSATNVLKYNVQTKALGAGTNGPITALCPHNDGAGPALYAGGSFTTAGTVSANNIAKWKNGVWEAVGTGANDTVYALCSYDDGTGPALYAGGAFTSIDGIPANHIARWKNGAWETLTEGIDGIVYALCVYDDGNGSALYAGGDFATAGGYPSAYIARWGSEPDPTPTSVNAAKLLGDTSLVSLTDKAATAVFGDTFYVENQDRTGGIRVDLPAHGIAQGREVAITGRIQTDASGERYVRAFSASDLGPLWVMPMAMSLDTVGGGTFGGQSGIWGWVHSVDAGGTPTRTWAPESGLNNIGMLVRVAGKFAASTSGTFYIGDGDEKVLVAVPSGVTINSTWQYVMVTAISSCTMGASGPERLLRVRSQSDIVGF